MNRKRRLLPFKNGNESSFCLENLEILKNREFFSRLLEGLLDFFVKKSFFVVRMLAVTFNEGELEELLHIPEPWFIDRVRFSLEL